jgi:hypothetical protein
LVKVEFGPCEDLIILEFQKFELGERPWLRARIKLEESGAVADVPDDQIFCSAAGWLKGEE